ncbi:MAG: lamin tail domain-containing protein, partial [Kiritimatiellae bacterium]|nr:lamin tail domain-containing protein [Kiritimatiellia bacterium]
MNQRVVVAGIIAGLAGVFTGLPAHAANMVVNPGIETGTATTAPPWEQKNGGSSFSSTTSHNGSRSIRLVNDYDGTSAPSHDVVQRVTGIVAGKEYMYYVWVKGDDVQGIDAGGKPMGMLTWKTSSGSTVRRWINMHAPYGTYTWRQMTCYCEAPPNATQCDVYVRSWWDCTNGVTYWDDFWMEERDFSHRGSLLNTYQAESASSRYDCTTSTEEPDYTGSGYVVPNSNSSYIQWNAVNEGAGVRYLVFRYSIEAGTPTWEVLLNGVSQGTKVPVVTGTPEGWATIEWQVTLNAGDNTVRLKPKLGVVGPWIDKLEVYAPSGTVPGTPTALTATAVSSTRITLSWADADDQEDGFRIDRRETGAADWTVDYAEVGENVCSYSDAGLPAQTLFYYRVKAYNLVGVSAPSAVASAETLSAASVLISRASSWRYVEGTAEASDPRDLWRATDFDDSAWPTGQAPFGYGPDAHEGPSCNTVLTQMENRNSSVFLRKTFTVTDVSVISELKASVDYDDGFIIWINGERVAEENAPDSATYNALASASHEADVGYQDFLIDMADADLEQGENVLAVQAFNAALNSTDFKIDVELAAVRRVADTKFSHDRGFYDTAFSCTISTETTGATVYCTLNGTDPRAASAGELISGLSPLAVTVDPASSTNRAINGAKAPCVVVRAYAARDGYEPTDTDTHTYLFVDRVRNQPNCMAGEDWVPGDVVPPPTYLTTERETQRMNTEMDPTVVNDSRYTGQIENALRVVPTLSVCGAYGDLFGNVDGIFHNSRQSGEEWERPASLELIHPDGAEGFEIPCGARVSGAWSRLAGKSKMSLSIRFRSVYGAGKLRYQLFPDTNVDKFDHIRLRAQGNDKFAWDGANAAYIRDSFGRGLQRAMGWESPTGRWVHLYINGMYWGLYDVVEVPCSSYMAEHYGGERDDYDVLANRKRYELLPTPPEGVPRVLDGFDTDFLAMHNWITNQNMATLANYQQAESWLNIPQHVDYTLIELWAVNGDWDANQWAFNAPYGSNWRCGQNRLTKNPRFEYFVWDIEVGIRNGHQADDVTGWAGIGHLHEKLRASPEYKMLVADRVYKHMVRTGGVLTPAALSARWQAMADEIELPLVTESARWGDVKQDVPNTVDDDWKVEIAAVKNTFLALRTGYAVADFKGAGLYPSIEPPSFNQDGGVIVTGFRLTLSNPNTSGSIVYTLDGSDPRLPGGGNAGGAIDYTSPVTLSRTTHVKARVRKTTTTWSAVQEATFNYTAHYSAIRITEIMYNPLGGGDFEFVEIKNTGSSTRGLSEMRFNGITYTFPPGTELAGDAMAVLVANEQAFTSRYPGVKTSVAHFGVYRGRLDNGGERLALLDCEGRTVTGVRYNDKSPWPVEADGDGYSLVFDTGEQDDPANWRASNLIGGSPGYDDGAVYRVVVSEVLSHTDLPEKDTIELHNAGSASVDIGGWYLSDSDVAYRKFRIPDATSLAAGGYIVFDEDDFNTDT